MYPLYGDLCTYSEVPCHIDAIEGLVHGEMREPCKPQLAAMQLEWKRDELVWGLRLEQVDEY